MRSTNSPPRWRDSSQQYSAVRAPPMCRYPVGLGAKRVRTVMAGRQVRNPRILARGARPGRPAVIHSTGRACDAPAADCRHRTTRVADGARLAAGGSWRPAEAAALYNRGMITLFISDLHLDPERPAITELFGRFLDGEARAANALYILGDLFEAWVGDDDPSDAGSFVA